MKKRVIARSVSLGMGACLFLYSNHALAAANIYDPMNPSEAITPIPNNELPETQDSDAEIIFESTESSETTATSEMATTESSTEAAKQEKTSEADSKPDRTTERKVAEETKSNAEIQHTQQSDRMWKFVRQPQTPLMLDDDFFSAAPLNMPEPISGGEAGEDTAFSQTALSAYLLSGVALYGEAIAEGETKLSDYFA
ncbi:hypothetical protein JZO70_07270 [Enterococcus sp. 669A]|uniref:Uncharacterized protein n=1 Tax=Candidatus Enterococcus moelleringii TaxID=2815325 RepID=A0ABS3L8J3_9ENTE|nr:hypothetical protein [Enterococcus sp. 669A]MBO1305954.1 hypothetical protein [Enterococcus sp. 669A]